MSRWPDGWVTRSSWLHVRVRPEDLEELDRVRGAESRSAFVRRLLADRSAPSWLDGMRSRRAADRR